jgi:hypothetical protein
MRRWRSRSRRAAATRPRRTASERDRPVGSARARCASSSSRTERFKTLLNHLDLEVTHDLEVHLILDYYSTHKTPEIHRWLLRHPRFVLHFPPTGS